MDIDLRSRRLRAGWILLLGVLLFPLRAGADAVPPAPKDCPRGQIGITSHAGPQCVAPPPKNCPPGWRPELRGVCRLELCDDDGQCEAGMSCREADLCLHEYLQEWGRNQRGESSSEESERPRNRPLFAGPPRRFDPPRKVVVAVDICGNDSRCAAPAKCSKSKVCLPKNVTRPGAWKGPKPSR